MVLCVSISAVDSLQIFKQGSEHASFTCQHELHTCDPMLFCCRSCHHGAHSKCINCVPLEPWDKSVQEGRDPPIKHLSFHAHIRKLTSGVDR